jgi:hypothetical protein
MKRLVALALLVLAAGLTYAPTAGPQAGARTVGTASVVGSAAVLAAVASGTVGPGDADAASSAHLSATTARTAPKAMTDEVAAKVVHPSLAQSRTAYVNAMYRSVVPARERAALAGHYTIGYNLSGLSCGTGCSGVTNGQARSSFDAAFFGQSKASQRNILAHEAAHGYGFLHFADYATASWAKVGGWQARFHAIDRSFVGTYDAEAWASCIAWKESGFNNRVIEISHVCTSTAATLAMKQIT